MAFGPAGSGRGKRLARFYLVGFLGWLWQLLLLGMFTTGFHFPVMLATPLAVELVVLHNFLWHERFTWPPRPPGFRPAWRRFARFQTGNGLISIGGNTALTFLLAGRLRAPPMPSALGSIAICSLINFLVADRWVYRLPSKECPPPPTCL